LFVGSVTEMACLAHVRRKFFDLHAANGSPVAAQALRRIAQLYVVKQQARDGDAVERLRLRQELAKPLLAQLSRLAHHNALYRGRRQRHGQGDRPCLEALAGADPLCRLGHAADR